MIKTIKIGMNYISSIPTETINQLIKREVIDTLKFPGISCNLKEMESFLQNVPKTATTDIHGILNFKPAWNMPEICSTIDISNSRKLFKTPCNCRFSTHIGLFPGINTNAFANIKSNLTAMREIFPGIEMGGENVFSLLNSKGLPRYMTEESSHPDFINEMWNILDFGVFDLSHAIIAAQDCKMSLENYISKLEKSKVKIIHIAGGVPDEISDTIDNDEADPHFPASSKLLSELKKIIPLFPNVDLIVSECAYSCGPDGNRITLTEQDYISEAHNLRALI